MKQEDGAVWDMGNGKMVGVQIYSEQTTVIIHHTVRYVTKAHVLFPWEGDFWK